MSTAPKVSIFCLAFNQKDYISKALESMLVQETNFDFEIIINDDASTDGTAKIIKKYQKKYPNIIKPIFHKENQYSQGKRNFIIRYLIPKASGDYFAVCEGDDYWIDPLKLRKQVDFLEKNKEYALCFHRVKVFFQNSEEEDYIYPDPKLNRSFNVEELLKENFIQTNSVMYRRQKYEKMAIDVMPGDWYLHLYHAQFGKIGFIDEVMSAYRRHAGGIWWEAHSNIDEIWKKHGVEHLNLYGEMLKMYGNSSVSKNTIHSHIAKMFNNFLEVDNKHGSDLTKRAIETFSDFATVAMIWQHKIIHNKDAKLLEKDTEIKKLNDKQVDMQKKIAHKSEEIRMIKSSKVWRLRNKIAKYFGKHTV